MNEEQKNYIDNAIKTHIHDGNFSQQIRALDIYDLRRFILYRIKPSDLVLTTGTSVGGDFVMPFGGLILEVGATVDTAGSTGTMQIDINNNAVTILDTKITIDSGEKTSRTAAIPPFVSKVGANFKTGDIFTFDIDTVQTTPAMGLTMFIDVIVTTY